MAKLHPAILSSDKAVLNFLLGGRATITVLNKETGTRYTYRLRAKRDTEENGRGIRSAFYVSVMTGPDNTRSYTNIGYIPSNATKGKFYELRGRCALEDSDPRVRTFKWLWNLVHGLNLDKSLRPASDNHISKYTHLEIWHEGKCCCCGRKLTVPLSIERGIGPECWEWYSKTF